MIYLVDNSSLFLIVFRQSKRVMSYQPGKSLFIFNTFVMNAQEAGLEQRVGTFDANNGIFFEDTGTGYQIVRRSYTSGSSVDDSIDSQLGMVTS